MPLAGARDRPEPAAIDGVPAALQCLATLLRQHVLGRVVHQRQRRKEGPVRVGDGGAAGHLNALAVVAMVGLICHSTRSECTTFPPAVRSAARLAARNR